MSILPVQYISTWTSHHMWLVTVELDSTALSCYCICSEAEDFIGERKMGQEAGGRAPLDTENLWHQISQSVHSSVGHLTFKPKTLTLFNTPAGDCD